MASFLLDSDILTLLQKRSQPAYDRLSVRLRQYPSDSVATSIVNFQEQTRGWLASLHKARSPNQLLLAYAELDALRRYYGQIRVLPFDQAAYDWFDTLRGQRLHLGTMDLRIAAIALATGATLVTRNLRDFRKVPGLAVEDWTT